MSERCPDCGNSVELHELFRDGRCPVVRLDWTPFTSFDASTDLARRDAATPAPSVSPTDTTDREAQSAKGADVRARGEA